jgi:hypothetical protein
VRQGSLSVTGGTDVEDSFGVSMGTPVMSNLSKESDGLSGAEVAAGFEKSHQLLHLDFVNCPGRTDAASRERK